MKNQNLQSIVVHPIPPVWNKNSRIIILGTMPSPKSREAGFFYMHQQNRFWKILPALFNEPDFTYANNHADKEKAIQERKNFIIRHQIALWDVLASCEIEGAADSSIKNAQPNNFYYIFAESKIRHVYCTGKTAFSLWKKHCFQYEKQFQLTSECLPSTSSANASWTLERLIAEYRKITLTLVKTA